MQKNIITLAQYTSFKLKKILVYMCFYQNLRLDSYMFNLFKFELNLETISRIFFLLNILL